MAACHLTNHLIINFITYLREFVNITVAFKRMKVAILINART